MELVVDNRGRLQSIKSHTPLITLLRYAHGSKATDPRDYVFALLGISLEAEEPILQPNYEKDERKEKTYLRVAKYMVEKGHALELLQHVTFDGSSRNLPSWVPQWDSGFKSGILGRRMDGPRISNLFSAGGKGRPMLYLSNDDQVLFTRGIVWGGVERFGGLQDNVVCCTPVEKVTMHRYTIARMSELVSLLAIDEKYQHCEYITDAIFRTPICDRWNGDVKAPAYLLDGLIEYLDREIAENRPTSDFQVFRRKISYMHVRVALGQHRNTGKRGNADHGREYLERVFEEYSQASTCLTAKGKIGQVPVKAEIGDVIVLIQGCKVPYLLRPLIGDTYMILEHCFVYGIMYGEEWDESDVTEFGIV
jgi:hypothetical protein